MRGSIRSHGPRASRDSRLRCPQPTPRSTEVPITTTHIRARRTSAGLDWACAAASLPLRVSLVRVFDEDPDLLAGLQPGEADVLRRRTAVPKLTIDPGSWEPAPADSRLRHSLGLLVLDGLLIRSVHLCGRECPELIGSGDVLTPWREDDHGSSVESHVSWTALVPTTVAVLDERFTAAICRWPTVMGQLLARAVESSHTLALHLAIAQFRHAKTRLRVMFWHLADRWGRVTPQGVHVPLALTHDRLAHLTCLRRPTASTALQSLSRRGEVQRRTDGTWLLTGSPPGLARAEAVAC